MRLTVLGCSGSLPGPGSAASGYLVEAEDGGGRTWRVVLDLGGGALGALQRHVRPAEADAVLITHLHPDHCLDLCGLHVALRHDPRGGRDTPLPVHGPRGTADRVAAASGMPSASGLHGTLAFVDWRAGQPVAVGPLVVTPHRVQHPGEAYGLRVEGPSERPERRAVLAYTGDTDTCPELAPLAAGADLLLAEAGFHEGRDDGVRGVHLTGLRAGRVAAEAAAGRLVLTHLPPWNDPDRARAEAREVWDGPLDVAATGSAWSM